jgi:hypothetical protein
MYEILYAFFVVDIRGNERQQRINYTYADPSSTH